MEQGGRARARRGRPGRGSARSLHYVLNSSRDLTSVDAVSAPTTSIPVPTYRMLEFRWWSFIKVS